MNVERLLGSLLSGGMGGGRRRSKKSSMLGGLGVGKAQVGMGLLGVAFAAFEHYQHKQGQAQPQPLAGMPPAPPTSGGPPPPPPPPPMTASPAPSVDPVAQRDGDLMLMVEVMIAAAHADGLLDSDERAAVLERAMQLDLDPASRKQLLAAMDQPPTMAQIAQRARPQIAPDLYAAAVIAITIDTEDERNWLASLAGVLGLDEQTCRNIEQTLKQ